MPDTMPDEDDEKPEMKVTDRRMFTPEGELREEYRDVGKTASGSPGPVEETAPPPPVTHAEAADAPPVATPGPTPDGGDRPDLEMPDSAAGAAPGFFDLVAVLAEPVPLYLGDTRLPDGRSAENLEAARFHIDLLDVLRQKTAGALDAQESSVLEDVLYRLRMRFVQKRG